MLSINSLYSNSISNNLSLIQRQTNQNIQRMTTGNRINSAKDDPAGLYVSKGMDVQISGLRVANQNTKEGLSITQTAEGALDVIQSNLMRLDELAIRSANGTIDDTVRAGIQTEVDEVVAEIQRIAKNTEYGGNELLSTNAEDITIQVGITSGASISSGIHAGGLKDYASGTALQTILTVGTFDVSTQAAAQGNVGALGESIDKVSELRADFGASMNRFESVLKNNNTMSTTIEQARGRIMDVDYAKETAELAKNQLLQQVNTSLLAQANTNSQMVLQLL